MSSHSCNNEIKFRILLYQIQLNGKHFLYFLSSTAGKQCNHRFLTQTVCLKKTVFVLCLHIIRYLVQQRISGIFHFHIMLLIERLLERQYHKQFIQYFLHCFDTSFLPCPNLRRHIVVNFQSCLVCEFCNPEIKTRIIHQNDRIGFP